MWVLRQLYLYQMLQGIAYCHSHRCALCPASAAFSSPLQRSGSFADVGTGLSHRLAPKHAAQLWPLNVTWWHEEHLMWVHLSLSGGA